MSNREITSSNGHFSQVCPTSTRPPVSVYNYSPYMKESCPTCNSESGIREILYGMPEFLVDESKYFIGGCCVSPNQPIWACIDCGWSGWSLNNSLGMKLSEWKCPICESIGKIRILGMTEQSTYFARNYTFEAEPPQDNRPLNGMCLKCGWVAVFTRTNSY